MLHYRITSFNKLFLFQLLSFFVCSVSFAQAANDSLILSQKLSKFIPKGYTSLDTAQGDLNEDKFPDLLIVLKIIGEDTTLDAPEYKRPLLILLGKADKTYRLAARNDDVVYCFQCGGIFGDPYAGIEIKRGTFTVYHFGGSNHRWSNDITFRYSKAHRTWYLEKEVDKGWHVFELDKVDSTVRTRKDFGIIPFEKYTSEDN